MAPFFLFAPVYSMVLAGFCVAVKTWHFFLFASHKYSVLAIIPQFQSDSSIFSRCFLFCPISLPLFDDQLVVIRRQLI